MSSILGPNASVQIAPISRWPAWMPVALGLAVLYLPTFYDLNRTLWNEEENAHGPLILMVVLWLFWRIRTELLNGEERPAVGAGATLLTAGLLLYVLGRSQSIILVEVGSIIPVVAGLLLLCKGWRAMRSAWFPLLFTFFMLPLPGLVTEPLTSPLRQHISSISETLLYAAGYPIARSGVVLNIGQYQLLVAEACSGINSIFSLSALGLLYLYLMRYPAWWRNAALLASIVPIAFLANLVRVMVLVLITYHFGDAAGQGFIHQFAGMTLFIAALLLLFALDALLGLIFFRRRPA
jgi:exosortase B